MKTAPRTKLAARARLARAGIAPRGLPLDEAAAYVNLSANAFLAEVAAGTYPGPVSHKASSLTWDRRALDLALDRLSGITGAGEPPPAHVTAAMYEAIEHAEV